MTVPALNYPSNDTMFGLREHFFLQCRVQLQPERSGVASFCTFSDDGSVVYIDDENVVDNDGKRDWLDTLQRRPRAMQVDCGELRVTAGHKPAVGNRLNGMADDVEATLTPTHTALASVRTSACVPVALGC
eukprot:5533941-Prymnesium_polylepis.1